MKAFKQLSLATAALVAMSTVNSQGQAQQQPGQNLFTGDTKLACEAILCLSTGQSPSECNPSLQRYFSIHQQGKHDTPTPIKRLNFLNQCPTASHDSNMASLVSAIAYGAGSCDAATLNATLRVWNPGGGNNDATTPRRYIRNDYPAHCKAYTAHSYTDLKKHEARYVGDPLRGGFWATPESYDAQKAAYDKRIEAEDKAKAEAEAREKARSGWSRWEPR